MTTSLATTPTPELQKYVVGDGNIHRHTCKMGHDWFCDSCYCNSMQGLCPDHGGVTPKLNASR
jgi:hypothetical protein